jgi:hypothetical protein
MNTDSDLLPTVPDSPAVVRKQKKQKLRPARKQVKPGEIERKEEIQTGKEYSKQC